MRKHKLPIIADEIYAHMCFLATLSSQLQFTTTALLSVGGMAKEFWFQDDVLDGLQYMIEIMCMHRFSAV